MATIPNDGQTHQRRFRPFVSLANLTFRAMPGLKPRAQRAMTRYTYEYLNRKGVEADISFMNYGYALPVADPGLSLRPEDEDQRTGFQMYDVVAGAIDLAGKDVLEVGCGRGGGAAFVAQHLAPRSVTGIDLAERAIGQCLANHHDQRLHFAQGDAENLPFPEPRFDAVINIESSHAYPDFERFLSEVHRVLRPTGHLLFADFRETEAMPHVRSQFAQAGFTILEEESITQNVVRSLDENAGRMDDVVQRSVPK
ncbi:MAG: class I SAM-dependent methyltransferase, partial [Thermomicrobiales bacterium]|nr:class I SAM-dependent methyltransferase [Thermomicrobiales bacterium]